MDYIEQLEHNNIFHHFVYNLNQDCNYDKDLCIITQVSHNHFNLLFHKSYHAYKNLNKRLIFLIPIINNKNIFIDNNDIKNYNKEEKNNKLKHDEIINKNKKMTLIQKIKIN